MIRPLPIEERLGFAQRIADALRQKGYCYEDGTPDAARFAQEHGWNRARVARWLTGIIPRGSEARRLAQQLDCTLGYLIFGEGKGHHPLLLWLAGLLAGLSLIASPAHALEPRRGIFDELPLQAVWREAQSLLSDVRRWLVRYFTIRRPGLVLAWAEARG